MNARWFAVACAVLLTGLPAGLGAQTLTHYVKYEAAGRVAWGLLEGQTIRELQGNVFEGAKPNGRTLKLAEVKLLRAGRSEEGGGGRPELSQPHR
jgi:hypothetical protein